METQPDDVMTRETATGGTVAGDSDGDTDPCHPCHSSTGELTTKRVVRTRFRPQFEIETPPLPSVVRSEESDARFFSALENGHPVGAACRAAGYTRQVVYRWRQKDCAFDERWRSAQAIAADLLEEEADRRGRDGYMDPVFSMGHLISERRRYSDGLLLARLKAVKPGLYRERKAPPAADQRQITIVIRDFEVEDLMLRLVKENKLRPSDLPAGLQARLLEQPALSDPGRS